MSETFLNEEQIIERYNGLVSKRQLVNWRQKHIGIPYIKLGGKIAYKLSDVLEYEKSKI